MRHLSSRQRSGFTIIEIVVVIVVLAILATLAVVGYNTFNRQTRESSLESNLEVMAAQLSTDKKETGDYPAELADFNDGAGPIGTDAYDYVYTVNAQNFCLVGTSKSDSSIVFSITQEGTVNEGSCTLDGETAAGGDDEGLYAGGGGGGGGGAAQGTLMQTIQNDECPTARTWVKDARDNHTYWIQKLADDQCWMLTDLAYEGGGYGGWDDYGDSRSLVDGTGSPDSYTNAYVYVPSSGTNVTVDPNAPSTSTDGTGQYGYLYNWCAAMGGQANAACANAATPVSNDHIAACPAGWRLPSNTELTNLNTLINGGSEFETSGLRTTWLAQFNGYWSGGLSSQGFLGSYWSSTQASAGMAYLIMFEEGYVAVEYDAKFRGHAIRCVTYE